MKKNIATLAKFFSFKLFAFTRFLKPRGTSGAKIHLFTVSQHHHTP